MKATKTPALLRLQPPASIDGQTCGELADATNPSLKPPQLILCGEDIITAPIVNAQAE